MTDLTALANLATPVGTDIVYVVDDPTGTPIPTKCSIANLLAVSHTHAQSDVTDLVSDLAAKAPLASPTFTGTVAIPNYANVESTLDTIEINRAPIASPTFTGTVTLPATDLAGNDLDNIQNLTHDISTTTVALDFTADELQTITISATATFTCSAYVAGKSKVVKILDDGSGQTLAFPSGWIFVGTKPTAIAAGKTGILTLTCFSTTEASVVAAYAEQE